MDFVGFLSMVNYVILYTQCLRYNNCSAWFLDIRISTCILLYSHIISYSLMLAMSVYDLVLYIFVILNLPYLNYSKSLTMQPVLNFPKGSFGQKKPVHYSFQGKWFSS